MGHRTHRVLASTAAADFAWKSTRGALIAVAVGAIAAFGGRGMAEAGISPVLIWTWGAASFAVFVVGLCFWAMSASRRWGQTAAVTSAPDPVADTEQAAGHELAPVVEPGRVVTWEDESDRDYRRFVELHRPGGAR